MSCFFYVVLNLIYTQLISSKNKKNVYF